MAEVTEFLRGVGLSQFADILVESGCDDMFTLYGMTVEDLRELGIPVGHRRKLLMRVAQHQNAVTNQNPATNQLATELTNGTSAGAVLAATGSLGPEVITAVRNGDPNAAAASQFSDTASLQIDLSRAGRGRNRSPSLSRSWSVPTNPQSVNRGRDQHQYAIAFGHGFERFVKRAICEFVANHGFADLEDPQQLGIHEADLVLRMRSKHSARELLPRVFVWQCPAEEFHVGSIILFEIKSSVSGVNVALRQLRDRYAGLGLETSTPIHLAMIVHCTEHDFAQGFPVPRILMNGSLRLHVIYTQFSLEAALQGDNANAGFRMPLPLRFATKTNDYEDAHVQSSRSRACAETIAEQHMRRSSSRERVWRRGHTGPKNAVVASATNVEIGSSAAIKIGSSAAISRPSSQIVASRTSSMTPEANGKTRIADDSPLQLESFIDEGKSDFIEASRGTRRSTTQFLQYKLITTIKQESGSTFKLAQPSNSP